MENTYWKQEDDLWYFYSSDWSVRYKVDFDNKSVLEQYRSMGEWEDGKFLSFSLFPPNLEELKLFVEDEYKQRLKDEEKFMQEIYAEIIEEENRWREERDSWKKELKGLINVKRLWKEMEEENDSWGIEGIVEIELTGESKQGYPKSVCAKIKGTDDYRVYTDYRGDGFFVWQTVGMMGDDYSGYLLHPLKDGRYLKTSYSC